MFLAYFGKQMRQPFSQATTFRASLPLELVHGELCGPISPPTPSKKCYVFVLIDDCTRYMWTILLKEKSEAFENFKVFKGLAEKETKGSVRTFRTDRGGEFMSHEFMAYCEKNDINRHTTAPYSPQQNGVVERQNRTLFEMTRSLLKHMSLPNYSWGETVRHATYLINRIATRSLAGQTLYEALRSKRPNLSHLKVFGCVCYARTEIAGRKKLDDRSKALVHLGTEPGSKAYRLLNPSSQKIVVSRDVYFDEDKQWKWSKDETEKSTESSVLEFDLLPLKDDSDQRVTEVMSEADDDGDMNEEDECEEHEEEDVITQPELRRSSRETTTPSYLKDYILLAEAECEKLLMIINNEPWDFNEAKELDVWVDACKDEIFSIEKNNTWILVDLPKGFKPIGLKWVFKIKRNADGSISKYKARLVAK